MVQTILCGVPCSAAASAGRPDGAISWPKAVRRVGMVVRRPEPNERRRRSHGRAAQQRRLEAKAAGPPVQRHAPSRPGVLQPCEPTRRGGRAGFRRTLRSEVDARAMLAVNGEKRVPDKDDQFMTMSPTAVRNLVQRIDRFVRRIQTEGFQPGPDTNCQLRDRTRMPGAGRLSRL